VTSKGPILVRSLFARGSMRDRVGWTLGLHSSIFKMGLAISQSSTNSLLACSQLLVTSLDLAVPSSVLQSACSSESSLICLTTFLSSSTRQLCLCSPQWPSVPFSATHGTEVKEQASPTCGIKSPDCEGTPLYFEACQECRERIRTIAPGMAIARGEG
jgi:hypothetical protein